MKPLERLRSMRILAEEPTTLTTTEGFDVGLQEHLALQSFLKRSISRLFLRTTLPVEWQFASAVLLASDCVQLSLATNIAATASLH